MSTEIEVTSVIPAGQNDAGMVARTHHRSRAEYKELTGVPLSIANRCDPCLAYHIRMALAAGATRQEFVESIRLAILSTGSITIPTTRYGYGLLRARVLKRLWKRLCG